MCIRDRPGGLVSYWLPVGQLAEREAKSIVAAFCAAFPDCSLWEGTPIDWILLGSRDASARLDEAAIRRPWTQPERAGRLRGIGIETPEQLAALFLADADYLLAWSNDVPPLVDNWPRRAPRWHAAEKTMARHYQPLMDGSAARERFAHSRFVGQLWPASLREASLPYFRIQQTAREYMLEPRNPLRMYELHRLLTETELETLPLWLLASDDDKQRIVDRVRGRDASAQETIAYHLGARALAHRDYGAAVEQFDRSGNSFPAARKLALYALAMAGRVGEAAERTQEARWSADAEPSDRSYWSFMTGTFGLRSPLDPTL